MSRLRVLHVCTGNLCRSPIAEHLMRAGLAARGVHDVDVGSAGTLGRDGPMDPGALDVLARRGIDGSAFRSRALTEELVAGADLVLTASREHRAAVAALRPDAVPRTYTLRELAGLVRDLDAAHAPEDLSADPAARAAVLLPLAAARRVPGGRDLDLADPYRGPRRGFARCAALVEESLEVVLDALVPRPGRR